jgi:hypothetical protein
LPLAITPEQRAVLREDILVRLGGVGDIELARRQGDYERARRLGLAFSDDLRLMSEDLGWGGEESRTTIELQTPPDVLRRALARMRDLALGLEASEEKERCARTTSATS